ncbi:MAG: hypothetical protein GY866_08880 [Proteobacteria bacterium]|nr:hypothetical protein [Pseudomonadota bacterium]
MNGIAIRFGCALITFVVVSAFFCLQAQPNFYEEKIIVEKVLKDFRVLIETWNEELYFEMYELGSRKSKVSLTQGEFAQRMVDLKWKPALKPLENEKVQILYRNFVVIYFIQEFEHKINITETIKKQMVFAAVMENNTWKFDLTQLINIPYEGKLVETVKKKEKKEKKEEKKPAEAQVNQVEAQGNQQ